MITIDTIAENDLPELSLLYKQLVGKKSTMDRMRAVLKQMKGNDNYYLLGAKVDNQLVGSVMGVVCMDLAKDCNPFMIMENMIVDEKWKGKGIGKLLMKELEKIVIERNCIFIQFCSSSYRKDAHAFYETIGYDPGEVKGYRKYYV